MYVQHFTASTLSFQNLEIASASSSLVLGFTVVLKKWFSSCHSNSIGLFRRCLPTVDIVLLHEGPGKATGVLRIVVLLEAVAVRVCALDKKEQSIC